MGHLIENRKEFEIFFKENYPVLCRIARGYFKNEEIVEEIVSETFVKLWNNRNFVQVSAQDYLVKSAVNTCIDYYRREKLYREKTIRIDDELIVCNTLADLDEDPLDYLIGKEQQEKINASIENLPERYRMTIRLCRQEGLSYEEVAQKMKISKNTVKSNLRDAMIILRENLKNALIFISLIINALPFFR